MKLAEALALSQCVKKHVDDKYFPGTYHVSKANISPGWYKRFVADDPKERSPVSNSVYYDFYNGLENIALYIGEDDWERD